MKSEIGSHSQNQFLLFSSRNDNVNLYSECCGDKCCKKDEKEVIWLFNRPDNHDAFLPFQNICLQKYDEEMKNKKGWCYEWLSTLGLCWVLITTIYCLKNDSSK